MSSAVAEVPGAEVPGAEGRRLVGGGVTAALVLLPSVLGLPVALLVAVPAALAGFVLCLRCPWRRVFGVPAVPVVAVCLASLVADFAFRGPQGYAVLWAVAEFPFLLLLLRRVARWAPERVMIVLGPLLVLAVVLLPLRFLFADPAAKGAAVAFTCVMSLFPAGVAAGVGLYFRTLEGRRTRAVAEALDGQRLQVAADLHDFVAHELTGIVVEAQSAQWTGDLGADETRELLARVEAAGVRALESMDRTVQSLRADAPPTQAYGLADLPRLVEQYAAPGPDARVELRMEPGLAGTLPRLVDDAAYRVVVEALTNVRRHAAGVTWVGVTVVRAAGRGGGPDGVPGGGPAVEVVVANNGVPVRAVAAARPGGGTGLAGLGLRVEALGGVLEWGPGQGGWRVRALLPG